MTSTMAGEKKLNWIGVDVDGAAYLAHVQCNFSNWSDFFKVKERAERAINKFNSDIAFDLNFKQISSVTVFEDHVRVDIEPKSPPSNFYRAQHTPATTYEVYNF